jgi:predicted RNase H-like HicB family nuclease
MRAGMSAGSGKFPGCSVRANLPEELEENIRDVYRLMIEEEGVLALPQTAIMAKELGIEA